MTARAEYFVQSLERGLAVIRALGGREPQTLTEVAKATGLTRAAARRFLLTLVDLGYVRGRHGRFELAPPVLDLGYAFLSSLSLPEVSQPHLEQLVEEVRESSSVSILDGDASSTSPVYPPAGSWQCPSASEPVSPRTPLRWAACCSRGFQITS